MTPDEAARILEVALDAAPEQIEARFLELRTKLEDKIAKAPTPGLKEKYRVSLEAITEAHETLTLAADSSSLPVLRRSAPAPPLPSSAAPAAGVSGPVTARRPAQLTRRASLLIRITAFTKAGFAAGTLAGILLVIGLMAGLIDSDEDALPAIGITGIVGLAVMPFVWKRSIRKAQERLAAGRSNTVANNLALVTLPFGLAALGLVIAGIVGLSTKDRTRAEWTLLDQGPTLAAFEARWHSALRIEDDLKREVASARSRSESRSNQAELRALEEHARWWGTTSFIAESRLHRITTLRALVALARNPRGEVEKAYYTAFADYGNSLTSLSAAVDMDRQKRQLPDRNASLRIAAEASDPKATVSLFVERGYQNAAAKAAGLDRLRKAAQAGEVDAMILLCDELEGYDGGLRSNGSLEWWTKAAESGAPLALFGMARVYMNEAGPLNDPDKAKQTLQRAIEAIDRISP